MLSYKMRIFSLALALVAIPMSLTGCGRTEAPDASAAGDRPLFVPDTKPVPPVKWADATVPLGTPIKLSLIDTLSSGENHVGDPFRALVTEAIVIGGSVVVPSGSNIRGVLREVAPAAKAAPGKGGMLALEFNRIDTPTGANAPLKGKLTELVPGRSSGMLAGESFPGAVLAGGAGREAVLMSNAVLTLVLEEPLRIKVKQ